MIRATLHYLWHWFFASCRRPVYWIRDRGGWRRINFKLRRRKL